MSSNSRDTPPQSSHVDSTHRLPAISASQIVASQRSSASRVSTGSLALNKILSGDNNEAGIEPGHLIEITGPPGSGKTTLAMQLAVNSMASGGKALWIDTFHQVRVSRFVDLLQNALPADNVETTLEKQLELVNCPTLAHLIVLLLKRPAEFPPPGTSILVIDNISTPFTMAYPPSPEEGLSRTAKKDSSVLRRFSVMADLANGLRKIAAVNKIPIVVINQANTRVEKGLGAVLRPSVASPNWAASFTYRIFLYRKDTSRKLIRPKNPGCIRRVAVQAVKGKVYEDGMAPSVAIAVETGGITEVVFETEATKLSQEVPLLGKRKRPHADEIPASDEESEESDFEYLEDFL